MTGTQRSNAGTASRPRTTWRERAIVLGGIVLAALYTVAAAMLGLDMETVAAAWLAAIFWTVPSSLALALRRGFVHRDWSAFRQGALSGDSDALDWSARSGDWSYMRIGEEHDRLMSGN